jgi:hypothetical protein
MELKNQYPECQCGHDHYFFTCECGNHAFHINAAKKLFCSECHNVFELSKVLSMMKKGEH